MTQPDKATGEALIRDAGGGYKVTRAFLNEDEILQAAEDIIERRFWRQGVVKKPEDAVQFLRAKLIRLEEEAFGCLFLDRRHRVIAWRVLFNGTIDSCTVYPREVVRRALAFNAAAVIFAHQHPSGHAEPSKADEQLTRRLRDALALVDVEVLDHLVIGADAAVSLAERGVLLL